MDLFWKASALAVICVILGLTLKKWDGNFFLLLSLLACCMLGTAVVSYMKPVITMIERLDTMGSLGDNTVKILLKIVGTGIVGEMVSLICADAGNASVGKLMEVLTSCAVLWLSIPIIDGLVNLIIEILGAV